MLNFEVLFASSDLRQWWAWPPVTSGGAERSFFSLDKVSPDGGDVISVASPPIRFGAFPSQQLAGAGLIAALCIFVLAPAQSSGQTVASDRPSFDTATVKLAISTGGRGAPAINSQSLSWRGATLKRMICEAYQVQSTQVFGAPEWTDTERFEVIARVDKPATPDQIRLMLQNLLADRFRLSVQRQTKNLDVLALSVVRGGPKINPILPDQLNQPDPPVSLNAFHRRATMSQLASMLSQMLSGPIFNPNTGRLEPRDDQSGMIIDQTGLNGIYDINLNLNLSPDVDLRSGVEAALNALGLRLQSKRVPVETIFVAAVERVPIGN